MSETVTFEDLEPGDWFMLGEDLPNPCVKLDDQHFGYRSPLEVKAWNVELMMPDYEVVRSAAPEELTIPGWLNVPTYADKVGG